MILNFSIQNFGSIKERQTISFEATKTQYLEDYFVCHFSGHRVLKLALLFGANGSGKTNILVALNFLIDLILAPKSNKNEQLNYRPFLFDTKTPKENSILEIEFIAEEYKYQYKVMFSVSTIFTDELYYYEKKKKLLVFRRFTDEKSLSRISFGRDIISNKTDKQVLESNTLANNTVLGGFLKTNIYSEHLEIVTHWFQKYAYKIIRPEIELSPFIHQKIENGEISEVEITEILAKADFSISGFDFKKVTQRVSDDVKNFLKLKNKMTDEDMAQYMKEDELLGSQLFFKHTFGQKSYELPNVLESRGTLKYFGFAGVLALSIKRPSLFIIDEIDSSLHPDLLEHFLTSFVLNVENSQIIASVHNRDLLTNKDLYRKDAIWFTDKNENGATEVYSLADFDESVIKKGADVLETYKSGKLRAIPNPKDPYLNVQR